MPSYTKIWHHPAACVCTWMEFVSQIILTCTVAMCISFVIFNHFPTLLDYDEILCQYCISRLCRAVEGTPNSVTNRTKEIPMNQLGFENIKISCQMILLPLCHCTLNGIPSRTIRLSFIYCVRNIVRRVWTHTNVLTAIIALCLFLHCTLFGFAKVIVYLILCYRPATTSFASPRKQTEGTRNQSALGREVTPPKSPTPDQTSQVIDYESGRFILYRFFLKRGGEAIKSQPPLALTLS